MAAVLLTAGAIACSGNDPEPETPVSRYYGNCKALRAEFPNGLPKSEPGYRKALDADGDGHACERGDDGARKVTR